ncbi:hypothetical protein EOPP23_02310 [Endozoicomonas sp. OPT23]|uniref:hypothetical protein n=1 Tax=Endozoicomonas sp. OPT23 TaxID=2072845 RepID=UPI00129B287E|nr:hypothetical protein [Endozoicomonas sp. OPT23]MRI31828.1 hypothetical protein [Endozoicomonas sp. OPT23]
MSNDLSGVSGSSGQYWQTAPAVERHADFKHRKVTKAPNDQPTLSERLKAKQSPDKSLKQRKVEVVKVSTGGLISMAAKIAKPFVNKVAAFAQSEPHKDLKSETKSLDKEISKLEGRNKKLENKILSTRRQLHPPSHGPFKSPAPAPDQVAGLKADLQQLQSEKYSLEQQLQNSKQQKDNLESTTRQLTELNPADIDLGSATSASAKLLSGMRNAYKFHQNPKNADKAAAIDIGTLKLGNNQSVKDMQLVIGSMNTNSDGSLTIHVDKCSASQAPEFKGPVSASDIEITIKPPLSTKVTELLSCNALKVPSKLAAMQKEMMGEEEVADLSEFVKIDMSAMSSGNLSELDSLPENNPIRMFLESVIPGSS